MSMLLSTRRWVSLAAALVLGGRLSLPDGGVEGRVEGSKSRISATEDDVSDQLTRVLHRSRRPKNPFKKKNKKWDREILQDVTPGVLFGSGNSNGYFNTCRNPDAGVEVGLRAKLRFRQDDCSPVDCATDNSTCNADGTYSFENETVCANGISRNETCGFSDQSTFEEQVEAAFGCGMTPPWSFDWAVNVAYDHNATLVNSTPANFLSNFTYELGVDCDGGDRTEFDPFDPISLDRFRASSVPAWDHVFSTNDGDPNDPSTISTVDNITITGPSASDAVQQYYDGYKSLLDTNHVVQNSYNVRFLQFPGTCLTSFDPEADGHYLVYMCVKDGNSGKDVCCAAIQVLVGDAELLKRFGIPGHSSSSSSPSSPSSAT